MAGSKDGDAAREGGAFGKDRAFGRRLDQTFPLHEPFLLVGAKVDAGDVIETVHGEAQVARLLVRRLDEKGFPAGEAFEVTTVATAIVDKVKAVTADELRQGPVCVLDRVESKRRGGTTALVLTLERFLADAIDYEQYGTNAADAARTADMARPESERMPAGY